jgi:hypothetical protein
MDGSGSRTICIETFKSIEFYQDPKNMLSAKVCRINGQEFVGIDKFWCEQRPTNSTKKVWLPTKKGHLYLKADQWRALAVSVPALTQALKSMEKKMQVVSSGMHTMRLL